MVSKVKNFIFFSFIAVVFVSFLLLLVVVLRVLTLVLNEENGKWDYYQKKEETAAAHFCFAAVAVGPSKRLSVFYRNGQ